MRMYRKRKCFRFLEQPENSGGNNFETYENERPCAVRNVCGIDRGRGILSKFLFRWFRLHFSFLFTMLAGLLLGPVNGALAVVVYIVLGLVGLPIFTQGGGPGYIFQPSFGYIIGFAVAAYVTGRIANEKSHPGYRRLLAANFIGLFIVYAFGMVYYYAISNFVINTPIGLWPLFLYCFLLAVPGDIALCILAAVIGKRMIPMIKEGRLG